MPRMQTYYFFPVIPRYQPPFPMDGDLAVAEGRETGPLHMNPVTE